MLRDVTDVPKPLVVRIPFGEGTVTAVGFDVGEQYYESAQYLQRNLMKSVSDALYTPICKLESALGLLEIVTLCKDGKLMIQLVNGNGNHTNPNSATEDFIPPVVDVKLSIALPNPPKKLLLQPEGKELAFTYENGRAYVSIDRVNIHDIIEVVE